MQVQLAPRLDILHGLMQVLLPLGHVTWDGQGSNSMWVAMVPELPGRTLGQGSFSCGGSTFRGTQHHIQHLFCLLHTFFPCCALLIMGWEPNLPRRGMHDTCSVTVGCVTPVLSLWDVWHLYCYCGMCDSCTVTVGDVTLVLSLTQHAGNLYCSCCLQGQSQRLRQGLASIRRD